jgi:hypothetical protein
VLNLVLVLLLVWFVLTVLLAAWTLWFQAYIYSEPVGAIWWRAPAAGTALALFLTLWVVLDYRAPGRYRELHGFSFIEYPAPYPELHVFNPDGKEEVFKLHKTGRGLPEYRWDSKKLPSRPGRIIVFEDGEKFVFEPERDARGNFKTGPGDVVHYRDSRGREMVEGQLGQVSIRHYGWLAMNFLLNFAHLAVWFACLWLLLRFQWSHALGLAVVFWAVTTLIVVPMVLGQAERVALQGAPPAATRSSSARYHSGARSRAMAARQAAASSASGWPRRASSRQRLSRHSTS